MHSFLIRSLKAFPQSIAVAIMGLVGISASALSLPSYDIDVRQTSVSGLSSGGFMAVQFSVAYSSIIKGAGIIAGGPYYCAQGDLTRATTLCSCTGIPIFSVCRVGPGATKVNQLISITEQNARDGKIDPTANLAQQKIWMFSGSGDSIVPTPVMDDLQAYYQHYINAANIRYRKDIKAEHAVPTDSYGNKCDALGSPYINNCGFDGAGDLLKWIYGSGLHPRNTGVLSGRFIEFDQAEFVAGHDPAAYGMAAKGMLYVPGSCAGQQAESCKLHVAFHGCAQNRTMVGDRFVEHAGYNQWADTNDIIVLYPQTTQKLPSNPKACWNWFDYDGNDPNYATKNGAQMAAVKAMVDRIAGIAASPSVPPKPCFTANNAEHILAGRAYARFLLTYAKGSNALMGLNNPWTVTTLKQAGPDVYVIAACN